MNAPIQISTSPPPELPSITQEYLIRAYVALCFPMEKGFDAAYANPHIRAAIQAKAKDILEWQKAFDSSYARTVVPVPGIRLGTDGHPIDLPKDTRA